HAEETTLAEPVDWRSRIEQAQLHQTKIERAEAVEEPLEPNGTHERRHDQRHQEQRGEESAATKPIARESISQRQAQERRGSCGDDGNDQAVAQALPERGRVRLQVKIRKSAGALDR